MPPRRRHPWRLEHASYASVASRQSRSTSTGTVRTRSVRNVNDYCAVTVASRLKRRLCGIVACALLQRGCCRFGARPQREGMTASCPSPSRFDGGAASTGRLCWREEGGADAAALQGFQLRFFQTAQPLARNPSLPARVRTGTRVRPCGSYGGSWLLPSHIE